MNVYALLNVVTLDTRLSIAVPSLADFLRQHGRPDLYGALAFGTPGATTLRQASIVLSWVGESM